MPTKNHGLLTFLILAMTTLQAVAADPHPSLPVPGRMDGLGVNIHFTDPRPGEVAMLAAGGFRWVRMDFTWSATERAPGRYDFSAYDRLLDALKPHGIRVLFILDYSNKLYEKDRSVITDQGRQAYARWAAAAAAHFKDRGILWEIWNEPNISHFWKPEPNAKDYVELALQASHAIRKAAPDDAIIGPATSTVDLRFLEACFRAGLLECWDAVSVHPYRQANPETAVADYHKLRELIDRYIPSDKNVPILSAEWGYSAAWRGFDSDRQGVMLSRQWLINLSHGIPLSIWYDWHDDGPDPNEPEHHFGTVAFPYHKGRTPVYDPKPAYLAAKTLTEVLNGCVFVKRLPTSSPNDYVMLFRGKDQLRLAVWTTEDSSHTVKIPSSPCDFEVLSNTGQSHDPLSSERGTLTITVTPAPQFLIAKSPNPKLLSTTVFPGVSAGPVGLIVR